MWLAAGNPDSTQLLLASLGLLGIVVTAITGVIIAIVNARQRDRGAPADTDLFGMELRAVERIAVIERRQDDNDERDEIQDRRLDQIERTLDLDNPEWRR